MNADVEAVKGGPRDIGGDLHHVFRCRVDSGWPTTTEDLAAVAQWIAETPVDDE
jgi:hypothetical protein